METSPLLSNLLEDLADLIFQAAKSSTSVNRIWAKKRESYKINIGAYDVETSCSILQIDICYDYDYICKIEVGPSRSNTILRELKEITSPEKFDEILKTLKKICLLVRLERSKNE